MPLDLTTCLLRPGGSRTLAFDDGVPVVVMPLSHCFPSTPALALQSSSVFTLWPKLQYVQDWRAKCGGAPVLRIVHFGEEPCVVTNFLGETLESIREIGTLSLWEGWALIVTAVTQLRDLLACEGFDTPLATLELRVLPRFEIGIPQWGVQLLPTRVSAAVEDVGAFTLRIIREVVRGVCGCVADVDVDGWMSEHWPSVISLMSALSVTDSGVPLCDVLAGLTGAEPAPHAPICRRCGISTPLVICRECLYTDHPASTVAQLATAFTGTPVPHQAYTKLVSLPPAASAAYASALCVTLAHACQTDDSVRAAAGPAVTLWVCGVLADCWWTTHADVCTSLLRAIRWLVGGLVFATRCEPNMNAIADGPWIRLILSVGRVHLVDPALCAQVCDCIMGLARSDAVNAALAENGAAAFVIDALRTHAGVDWFLESGMAALGNLVTEPKSLVVSTEPPVLELVFALMRAWPKAAMVQMHGCRFLANVCVYSQERVRGIVCAAGAVPIVIAAFDNCRGNDRVAEHVCRALRNVVGVSGSPQVAQAAKEIIRVICLTMDTYPSHVAIQENGIGSMCSLAFAGQDAIVVSHGGLSRMFLAMDTFHDTESIQDQGVRTMVNLTQTDAVRLRAVQSGGLERLGEAMRAHPTNLNVQRFACGTLVNVAKNSSGGYRVVMTGLLDLALAACANHPAEPSVQEEVVRLMVNISVVDALVRREGIQVACLPHLVAAMRGHTESVSLQQHACWALAGFAAAAPGRVAESGVLPLLDTLLRVHVAEERVVVRVFTVLAVALRAEAGMSEAVRAAVQAQSIALSWLAHAQAPSVQLDAVTVMSKLCEGPSAAVDAWLATIPDPRALRDAVDAIIPPTAAQREAIAAFRAVFDRALPDA